MKTLLIVLLTVFSAVAYSDIVVVVSKDSITKELNSKQIANIFLSRTNRFPNGEKSTPIELKAGGIRSNFYKRISGKNPNQLAAYWTTLIFTGKGRPPKSYNDINDLIERIKIDPRTIAYLNVDQVTDAMKIVYHF